MHHAPARLPLALLVAFLATMPAPSEARPLIYRGELLGADGEPITEAVELAFSLRPAADAAYDPEAAEVIVEVDPDDRGAFEAVIPTDAFDRDALIRLQWLGIRVRLDRGSPWQAFPPPHPAVGAVPYALVSDDVQGAIHPESVHVGGREVISADGRWVGDLTLDDAAIARLAAEPAFVTAVADRLMAAHGESLRGDPGEEGPPGDAGPAGAAPPLDDVVASLDTPELRDAVADRVGVRGLHWEARDITVCDDGCDFADLDAALAALDGYIFRPPDEEIWRRPYCWVRIHFSGHFVRADPLTIRHPQGQHLCLMGDLGAEPATLEFAGDGVVVERDGMLGELSSVDIVGAGGGTGLRALDRSYLLVGNNVRVRGFDRGVAAEGGSYITTRFFGGGAPIEVSDCNNGIVVRSGAQANMSLAVVRDHAEYGLYAEAGAWLRADGATVERCGAQGVRASASFVSAVGTTVHASGNGFVGVNGALMNAPGSGAACNAGVDYSAGTGALIIAHGAAAAPDAFSPAANRHNPAAILHDEMLAPPAVCDPMNRP